MTGCPRISKRDRRIVCLWLAGVKSEAIASELGICRGNVTRRAGVLGLPMRIAGPQRRQANMWPCIVAWAKAGFSAAEIAAGIGCRRPEVVAGIDAGPGREVARPQRGSKGRAEGSREREGSDGGSQRPSAGAINAREAKRFGKYLRCGMRMSGWNVNT